MKIIKSQSYIKKASSPVTFQGTGYTVTVSEYSNKGPIVIFNGKSGEQRIMFDLDLGRWRNLG